MACKREFYSGKAQQLLFAQRERAASNIQFLLVSSVIYRDRFPSDTEQYTRLSFALLWVLLIYPLYLLSATRIIIIINDNNNNNRVRRKESSVRVEPTYIFVLKPRKNFYFS